MKIDIYSSALNTTKYLAIESSSNISTFAFPPTLDRDFLQLRPFKSQYEIIAGGNYIALDADDVIKQIQSQGFATFTASVTTTVTVGS